MPTTRVRVRMYRTGFGDCFLASFGSGASARHVLIDFGVHPKDGIGTMDQVMANIESVTGGKLALLVVTHAHEDHISGFGQFAERFAKFKIGEVWMSCFNDPGDKRAVALERRQMALCERLERHLQMAAPASGDRASREMALAAVANLKRNAKSMSELAHAFGTGAQVRYLAAGASFSKVAGIAGLSADILAPSKDKAFLGREEPPANQRYLTGPGDPSTAVHPFENLEIAVGSADYDEIVREGQPILAPPEIEELQQAAEVRADRVALALEGSRNNSSLVILFRFCGKSLLFPGDAQWGSWTSWIGTDEARQIISEVDFLKVAHHGSENATPVDVVHALGSAVAMMVPTQVTPFPTIPRKPLLEALKEHSLGHAVVRSDWIEVPNAPRAPRDGQPRELPRGLKSGELWIDYQI